MSRLHILQRIGPNLYEAVMHAPVPEGTNSAGVEWSAAIVAAGLNRTTLTAGKGGTITDEEAAQILAGTVIEGRIQWGEDEGLKNASEETLVVGLVEFGDIDAMQAFQMPADEALKKVRDNYIAREIAVLIKETQERLDRFGETVE